MSILSARAWPLRVSWFWTCSPGPWGSCARIGCWWRLTFPWGYRRTGSAFFKGRGRLREQLRFFLNRRRRPVFLNQWHEVSPGHAADCAHQIDLEFRGIDDCLRDIADRFGALNLHRSVWILQRFDRFEKVIPKITDFVLWHSFSP